MAIELLPLDLDPRLSLWRYMKWSTFCLLNEGTVFFPSIKTLQRVDPLEGDLHPEREWLIGKLNNLPQCKFKELNAWLRSKGEVWERRNLDAKGQNASFRTQLLAEIYIRELAKRRAVWCWFNSNTESAGMWSNYGYGGIAVRTTLGALKQALPAGRDFQIARIRYAGREVNAADRFNPEALNDDPRIYRPHLVKGSEYKSENEIRVVTSCSGSERGTLIRSMNANMLIQEVVISPLLPREEADALCEQIKKHRWTKMPQVRRSALLGQRAIESDETHKAITAHLEEPKEAGLPSFLDTL